MLLRKEKPGDASESPRHLRKESRDKRRVLRIRFQSERRNDVLVFHDVIEVDRNRVNKLYIFGRDRRISGVKFRFQVSFSLGFLTYVCHYVVFYFFPLIFL